MEIRTIRETCTEPVSKYPCPKTMISLLTAFQFLTIFPALIRRTFTAQELGRAVGFFPFVGLALGGIFY